MEHLLIERRERERVSLRCDVTMFVGGHPAWRGTILNLSSGGFFCLSSHGFSPGDSLQCVIEFTLKGFRSGSRPVSLSCAARVVRVEQKAESFGMACRIDEYALVRADEAAAQGDTRTSVRH